MGFKTEFGAKGPVITKISGNNSQVIISGNLIVNGTDIEYAINNVTGSGGGGTPAGYSAFSSSFVLVSASHVNLSNSFSALSNSYSSLSSSLPSSVFSEIIWANESSASGSAYPTSGISYIPLIKGASDYIGFQIPSAINGTVRVNIMYGMSVAHSGNVELRLDRLVITDGSSLTGSIVTGSSFTFTPGNDINKKTLTYSTSNTLSFAVSSNDIIKTRLNRLTSSNDTHTGDMRIIEVRVTYGL